jgi:hypothetical protein
MRAEGKRKGSSSSSSSIIIIPYHRFSLPLRSKKKKKKKKQAVQLHVQRGREDEGQDQVKVKHVEREIDRKKDWITTKTVTAALFGATPPHETIDCIRAIMIPFGSASASASAALAVFVVLAFPAAAMAMECDCDPRYCETPTCHTDGVCFVSIKRKKDDPGAVDTVVRCMDKLYLIPPERPFVCEYNHNLNHTYVNKCCKDGDFCNRRINLTLAPPLDGDASLAKKPNGYGHPSGIGSHQGDVFPENLTYLHVAIIVALPLLLLFVVFALLCFCHRKNYKLPERCWGGNYHEVASCETQSTYPVSSAGGVAGSAAGASLQDYMALSTGSGSGLPLLVQRSVARQVRGWIIYDLKGS